MNCQHTKLDTFAFFAGCQRKSVPCEGEAKWRVSVNPPKNGNDGTVLLCDNCNRFSYQTFPREGHSSGINPRILEVPSEALRRLR